MDLSRIFLVNLSGACRPPSLAAARAAFPRAEIVEVGTTDEAMKGETSQGSELLVLAEPDEADVSKAVAAVDPDGLPRWAVVILGRESADPAETVPAAEWTPPILQRVFRSAMFLHELSRENFRLKGDLRTIARRIRHDLYTPIGCICTTVQVLELLQPGDRSSTEAMIDNLKVSSREISQLVERISFVVQVSADPPEPVSLGMGEVIATVLKQMDPAIRRTGATVTLADSWPEVNGSEKILQVIWWNLLDNALKQGGRIHLTWIARADGRRFSVFDHGAGVPSELRDYLFCPFEKLHEQRFPGLGLSIVHRLVALLGGHCSYERHGDGTSEFSFTLPATTDRPGV